MGCGVPNTENVQKQTCVVAGAVLVYNNICFFFVVLLQIYIH